MCSTMATSNDSVWHITGRGGTPLVLIPGSVVHRLGNSMLPASSRPRGYGGAWQW